MLTQHDVILPYQHQPNVVRLTRLHTSCMYGLSGAHMHGTSFGQAEHDHPLISRLCRSCVSLSDLLSQRLSGEHPRNGPQSTPKSISKEPRNKKNQPRNGSQQVAGFAGTFSFGESDGMFDRQQNLKAKWGKRFALPHMHQAQLGLLYDTPRKGARRKALQTAFGRLTAILDVWWFHPEMGGFAKVSEIVAVHAKQKIKSVKKNRTQKPKQKRTPVVAICGEKPLVWSSCVASDIKITDRDDSSFNGLLRISSRSFAA